MIIWKKRLDYFRIPRSSRCILSSDAEKVLRVPVYCLPGVGGLALPLSLARNEKLSAAGPAYTAQSFTKPHPDQARVRIVSDYPKPESNHQTLI